MNYDAKLHAQMELQVKACGAVTAATLAGSFLLPVESGKLPAGNLALLAVSGAALTVGAVIDKRKEPLDRQKKVIEAAQQKVFAKSQGIEAAALLEQKRLEKEADLVKECDGNG